MSDRSSPTEKSGRVVRFRPRGTGPNGWRWPLPLARQSERPVADLTRFERASGEDDYRHRMTMNALALIVTTALVVIGIWLAVSIAEMRKNQDCFLQGRRNCDQVVIPPRDSG